MMELLTDNWQLEGIEAIIFDKDGTIVCQDLYWGEIVVRRVEAILEFYDFDRTLKDGLVLALGFDETSKKLTKNAPIAIYSRKDVIKFLITSLQDALAAKQSGVKALEHKSDNELFDEIERIFTKVHETINPQDFLEPISEALDLIKKLKELPVKLVLITSDGYKNTLKTLDKLGIMDDFELILGRENCDEPKETGKIVKEALELLGLNPANTIAIGDTKCDSDMAQNSNLKACILVSTGQVPIEELRTYSTHCTHSLKEIVTKT